MKIWMVVKTAKLYDEWVNTNIKPFLDGAKAAEFCITENAKLTKAELADYTEFCIEFFEAEA